MDSIIYLRIKELCEEQGITISGLEKELGFGTGVIGKWKNHAVPTIDKLSKIAGFFHTSVDYLIGSTDVKTPINDILSDSDIVSLQRARENMTSQDKERMMIMLRAGFHFAFQDDKSTEDSH